MDVILWRTPVPGTYRCDFDETAKQKAMFHHRGPVPGGVRPGCIIAAVNTPTNAFGRTAAVPGLWVVESVEVDARLGTRAHGRLLVYQDYAVKWTTELWRTVGRRVKNPVHASEKQLACLRRAGVLLDLAPQASCR